MIPRLPASMAALRTIVEQHQCHRLRWPPREGGPRGGRQLMVDAFTARAVVAAVDRMEDPAKRERVEQRIAEDAAVFRRVAHIAMGGK